MPGPDGDVKIDREGTELGSPERGFIKYKAQFNTDWFYHNWTVRLGFQYNDGLDEECGGSVADFELWDDFCSDGQDGIKLDSTLFTNLSATWTPDFDSQEINLKSRINNSPVLLTLMLFMSMLLLAAANVNADTSGLNTDAAEELRDAGVDKYLGTSISTTSEHGVWTEHAFDPLHTPDASYPEGFRPVCIAGTDYSVFTR